MLHRLPPFVQALALATALLGSACTKNSPDVQPPIVPINPHTPGVINGQVLPAGAVFAVSLNANATGQPVATAAVDSQTGAYQLAAVPPGNYTLYFTQTTNYVRPRQLAVAVEAGKTTVVPLVTATRSTAAFTVDGAPFTPPYITLSLGFDGKTLPSPKCFSLVLGDGLGFSAGSTGTYVLFLTMPYAVHVGTYPLNDALTYAIFTDIAAGTFDSRANPATAPAGTLTITAVENTAPFPRSVSGTFSCTATNAATGAQKVISGTFANAYF